MQTIINFPTIGSKSTSHNMTVVPQAVVGWPLFVVSGEMPFIADSYNELTLNSLINQVGEAGRNGKETSSNRIFPFTSAIGHPLYFSGVLEYDGSNWICFEIPYESTGFPEEHADKTFYIPFAILDSTDYLLMPWHKVNGSGQYKSTFT